MNEVILRGVIRDISPSHVINNVEYDQANIITTRHDGKEDILSLKFKKFSNIYKDGDRVDLIGNIRSYSQKLNENKNKVSLYVFTYFDLPSTDNENFEDITNHVRLDGRICKVDELRITKNGKANFHFVVANNIISSDGTQKLNNYIPCVAWGKLAYALKDIAVSTKVIIDGELHSRTYKKVLENNDIEIKTAHELVVKDLEIIFNE